MTIKYEVMNKEQFGRVEKVSLFANHPNAIIPVYVSRFVIMPFRLGRNDPHSGGHIGL